MTEFYNEIKHLKNKNILIVAHSGIGRISHAYFSGLPKDNDFLNINIPNAGVVNFEFK